MSRSPSIPVASARGTVAALSRSREPSDPDLLAARVNLKAARVEDYISRVVNEAPPLSPEQRDRLATLLRGHREHPATLSGQPLQSADGE